MCIFDITSFGIELILYHNKRNVLEKVFLMRQRLPLERFEIWVDDDDFFSLLFPQGLTEKHSYNRIDAWIDG